MATAPKIKYEIEADASGSEQIRALARELDALDTSLDPAAAVRAAALRKEIEGLGQQQAAVARFKDLKREVVDTTGALQKSTAELDQTARRLDDASRAAKGFSDQEQKALQVLKDAQSAHAAAKLALKDLNAEYTGAARGTAEYEAALGQARAAVDEAKNAIRTKKEALKEAGTAADSAAAAERALRGEYDKGLSATTALSGKLAEHRRALSDTKSALEKAGIATTGLAATEDRLRGSLQAAESAVGTLRTELGRSASNVDAVGKQLEHSFKVLGIQSVKSVEDEVRQLRAALAAIKMADPFGPDALRAAQAFESRIAALRGEVGKLPAASSAAATATTAVGTAAAGAGEKLSAAAHKAVAWAAALTGLNNATDVARDLIATGAGFENLRLRMEQLLGSSDKAKVAFDQIKQLASTTPFEVEGLSDAFIKLTAFGLQPTEAQMRALADTAAVAGGGTQALERVTLALGQAWTKSKLQGDEILQLAEAGIPVWDLLAKATGKNVQELQDLSQAGALGRDVILKLFAALGEANAGASAKLMESFNGAVSQAKDSLREFYDMVNQAGLLGFLTRQIQDAIAKFEELKASGELQQWAQALSDNLIAVVRFLEEVGGALSKLIQYGPLLAEAFAAKKLADIALGLSLIGSAATAATASTAAMGAAATASAAGMASAGSAAGAAAIATRGMGLAMGGLHLAAAGGIVALVELGTKLVAAKRAAEEGDAAVRKMLRVEPNSDLSREFKEIESRVRGLQQEIDKTAKTLPTLRTQLAGLAGEGLAEFAKKTAEHMRLLRTDTAKAEQAFRDIGLAAAQALGVDVPAATHQTSDAVKGAVAEFDTLLKTLPNLQRAGVDTGQIVAQSLGNMIPRAKTAEDIAFIESRLLALESKGVISQKQLLDLLDLTRSKADQVRKSIEDATPGIQSLGEAARVAGVEVAALTGGATEGGRKAALEMRDLVDWIVKSGINAEKASPVLAEAFDKRILAAKTKDELTLLANEIERAAKAGKLLGDDAELALDKIKRKAQETSPELKKIADAYSDLGVKSKQELDRIAETHRRSWLTIRDDATATLQIKQEAFRKYAEAAIAANGGVASETLKTEANMRGLEIQVDSTGKAIVRAMNDGRRAVQGVGDDAYRTTERLNAMAGSLSSVYEAETKARADKIAANRLPGATYDKDKFATDGSGNRITAGTYLPPPDDSGGWTWVPKLGDFNRYPYGGYWEKKTAGGQTSLGSTTEFTGVGGLPRSLAPILATQPATAATVKPSAAANTSHTVTINLGGKATTIGAASAADASALTNLLREIETAAGRSS